MTTMSIVGATFSLVMTVGALAGAAYFATLSLWPVTVCLGCIALVTGVMVKSDWAKTWKPLLTGGQK